MKRSHGGHDSALDPGLSRANVVLQALENAANGSDADPGLARCRGDMFRDGDGNRPVEGLRQDAGLCGLGN